MMAAFEPNRIWWSADALVEAKLPGMPGTKRGINMRADQEGWRNVPDGARRKEGRGGGWLYNWKVLPLEARKALLVQTVDTQLQPTDRAEAWHRFEQLPKKDKDTAEARRKVLAEVDQIYTAGHSHTAAVDFAARAAGKSSRSVYGWLKLVEGVEVEDRLAYLVPKYRIAARKKADANAVRPFMDFLKSAYLRIAGQTFNQCYRKAVDEAEKQGWETLTKRTAQRRITKEVPRVTMVFLREGVEGLEQCFPSQIRDRTGLGAMGGVNADCHKIDVFVEWPNGTVNRPQIVAFQDLYSNKFLSWRVDHTPNSVMVMAAFGEMVEEYGIPKACLFDNGREFANKWLTAGVKTRFRFKIREDDPLGVLPMLGIQIHWARPAPGQSKPIERAFRDLANDIAKDPRFSGAYVGNRPDAKPENYASRAVPAETFLKVLDEGIREHNARQGRLTDAAQGRSFDDTFAESYASAAIRKATEDQRRLWLMGQHICKLNTNDGSIKFKGNVYHSDWMSNHPSRRVVARFDPEKLWDGLSVYDADGGYLGFAECQQKVGFFDIAGAQKRARRDAQIKKAQRDLANAHAPLSVDEVAAAYDGHAEPAQVDLTAKVVAPVFGTTRTRMPHQKPKYVPEFDPAVEAEREALILSMPARTPPEKAKPDETPSQRFWRAQELLQLSDQGKHIGRAEAEWVTEYTKGAEYQGQLSMYETFGESGIV